VTRRKLILIHPIVRAQPPGTIEKAISTDSLSAEALVGYVDPKTIKQIERLEPAAQGETLPTAQPAKRKIELAEIVGLPDFTVSTSATYFRQDGQTAAADLTTCVR
jgi:hypothetical protein